MQQTVQADMASLARRAVTTRIGCSAALGDFLKNPSFLNYPRGHPSVATSQPHHPLRGSRPPPEASWWHLSSWSRPPRCGHQPLVPRDHVQTLRGRVWSEQLKLENQPHALCLRAEREQNFSFLGGREELIQKQHAIPMPRFLP